ncbi:DUF4180 domain-containing protein [Clostridium sartagoforme]|uniref:DUF4180 domain-containing protein n=2 Tax=Clostridiaceae TaxID=31979 RepID=A0A4S2DNS0_9CLOT|nr:DUF4180 domain-containing protein [Clostridium sartagoforme]
MEMIVMKYNVVNKNNESYIILNNNGTKISSEQDMLDIIGFCFESGVNSVAIDGNILSDEFYDLKTKILGMSLQKFINYNIRLAIIINEEKLLSDRFKELKLELNKGGNIRVCHSIEEAEIWLVK